MKMRNHLESENLLKHLQSQKSHNCNVAENSFRLLRLS